MKSARTLTLVIAFAVAAIATAGQLRHRSNPLAIGGVLMSANPDTPTPPCIPNCVVPR